MVNPTPINTFRWQPINTAPADEKIWLEVTDTAGDVYALPFACIRSGDGFFTEMGFRLQVTPIRWKAYFPRTRSLHPRYKKKYAEFQRTPHSKRAQIMEDG